jgi:multimeric flavodoxin WrbA
MRFMAFNGSPRKTWNTATLLGKALEGAASQGAETTLVHLYDLEYTGCKSCFACKMKGGKSYGKCASRDALTPVLEQILQADAILLGSPLYFWAVTGEMKSFMERLMFPFYRYTKDDGPTHTLFPRVIPTGFIYTMGAPEERMMEFGYTKAISLNEMFLGRVFGKSESMVSSDTYQFDDYDKIDQDRFDVAQKAARRVEVFPQDCKRAFEMGARMASGA